VALRFLDQKEGLAFKHSTFCECLGFAAEACCYASAFGFKSLVSIEISEESQKLGYIYLKLIDERAARSFQSSVSRFQERIAVDAEVCNSIATLQYSILIIHGVLSGGGEWPMTISPLTPLQHPL